MVNHMKEACAPEESARCKTGVPGLDDILNGGLPAHHLHLIEGTPGSGKTTLSLQFLMQGRSQGEKGLYVTLSESADELRVVAASHGWSLEGIPIFQLVDDEGLDPKAEQTIFHPSDLELGETMRNLVRVIDEQKPVRVVFDSLSELRLLAQNSLRYRRQILALKHYFLTCNCTVLLLDDMTSGPGDLYLHSIVHGVVSLETRVQEYGMERRRLRIIKMRGVKYSGGAHDTKLDTGGMSVFPRLVAADHRRDFEPKMVSTGCKPLDDLLGGGLAPGTNTMFTGPSGIGKTTAAVNCACAALSRGEKVAYFIFDEGLGSLLSRAATLGMDVRPAIDQGQFKIYPIDPAELSPGEFASKVRDSVERDGAKFVVIDSLNGYLQAMPGGQYLLLQMHEMLTYLNQQGIITILILGQHGLIGEVRTEVDLSYLSDVIVAFKFFEANSELHKAVSVVKSRVAMHELAIREFRLGSQGLEIGEALKNFEGVLSGLPAYEGSTPLLGEGGTGLPTAAA
ncbi:MAG: Non-specific serine/threonine protein kinase [Betaproteobacteria bacterium]|nr:Non-specific serine/threonine protein kinase [Betaproteobacteria bacterium]